ncbi:CopG family ribbon-helix-helix protein [Novosphingobium sp. MMS21-SN21R]|uniref:CopG family ribbon-helix-helix protein n=1 Tax=Novosphingobium sp. MMS21-SN21R TaxID=2969298 RepID=UPI003904809B
MAQPQATEPITVRTAREVVMEIDALANAMARSRNYVVNQALQQYLETNAWQVARIQEGIEAAQKGQVQPATEVFAAIATKHGWGQ